MKECIEVAEIINKHLRRSPFSKLISVDKENIAFDGKSKSIGWRINLLGSNFKYSIKSDDKFYTSAESLRNISNYMRNYISS